MKKYELMYILKDGLEEAVRKAEMDKLHGILDLLLDGLLFRFRFGSFNLGGFGNIPDVDLLGQVIHILELLKMA